MKVLGHMEPPQNVRTQVNSFDDFESGPELFDYLGKRYGNKDKLNTMRSATYHQQVRTGSESEWSIFDGHVDKNFVHTAWFVPLTSGTFYTFVAVSDSWEVARHDESERKYRKWISSMSDHDRNKLCSFKETFEQQATMFMKPSSIQVFVYYCSLGSFLSFPANLCYHATVAIPCQELEIHCQMKVLLIVYPMESG